jgi:dihydrofolate reductase
MRELILKMSISIDGFVAGADGGNQWIVDTGLDTTAAAESWAKAHVATGDLKEEIAKLKSQDGKPIIAHGGVIFARSLVAAGVVDQYVLMVHPVVLGKGLPLFVDLPAPKILELVSAATFPRGGVAKIYRPT